MVFGSDDFRATHRQSSVLPHQPQVDDEAHLKRNPKVIKVENQHLVFPETMSDLAKDLIEKLVRKDPNERIKASQALQHPFLKNVNLN